MDDPWPYSAGFERDIVTLVVVSVLLFGIVDMGGGLISLNDDGELVVQDCMYATVRIYEKWYIEHNETYVFNTSTILGFNSEGADITPDGLVVAHVIVSEDIFNAFNESDLLDGWICSDEMITIDEWIDKRLITIIEGEIPWQFRNL